MHDPGSLNVQYLETLFQEYLQDASRVPPQWQRYFREVTGGNGEGTAAGRHPSFHPASLFNPAGGLLPPGGPNGAEIARLYDGAGRLLRAYRERGHLAARFNPLDAPREPQAELSPQSYGLGEEDLDRPIAASTECHKAVGTLRELVAHLQRTYCGPVGVEYLHIDDIEVRNWLCGRMEQSENRIELTSAEQIRIFTRLTEAVVFEEFLHKKYAGAKTFSLEGAEILIALLDEAIEQSAGEGVDEIVMGMAHRGRLNVLVNILHKSPRQIFSEFEDRDPEVHGGGDVKYHLGHSNTWTALGGRRVRLTLCFNPSHLEFVNPVAEGVMRANLDRRALPPERGLPILIHGDAAFAGEGVVQETLNLSRLPHYTTGGTLHVIVNNQIGFTTLPAEGRSTRYASDVAKMLPSPILHVNGEDPEAVAWVVALALDFRRRFQRDVVLDVYCYRRRGHNESDEPAFTQPLLYRRIESRPSVREKFAASLISRGVLAQPQVDQAAEAVRARLEEEFAKTRQGDVRRSLLRTGRRLEGLPRRPGDRRAARRHGGRPLAAGGRAGAALAHARGFSPAPQAPASSRPPAGDGAGPAALGLGGRRSVGLGDLGRRRLPRPPQRSGHGAGHLQPASRGAARR